MLDPLTLDQMRVLIAVAETGSFSAAARRLGRVQSAISQSVNALETAIGTPLFDRAGKVPVLNGAGKVIIEDARQLVRGAERLKARAESIAHDLEPELTLAVDSIVPIGIVVRALKSLAAAFPLLPVTLFTEGLGGAEQRLRDGTARLGFMVLFDNVNDEREAEFLMTIPSVPVAAADHPLAKIDRPLTRDDLETEVQLVITDRTPITAGRDHSVLSKRTWRFADVSARLEFLRAGFGWCNMPVPLVRDDIAAGRLKVLDIQGNTPRVFSVFVVHDRTHPPGRAGRWLVEEMRRLLPDCTGPMSLPQPTVA
jgi:DNA-binding transcriptional LysR family regulator